MEKKKTRRLACIPLRVFVFTPDSLCLNKTRGLFFEGLPSRRGMLFSPLPFFLPYWVEEIKGPPFVTQAPSLAVKAGITIVHDPVRRDLSKSRLCHLISKAVVLDGYVFLIVVVSEYTIVD